MRVAVFGDVHANGEALDAVLAAAVDAETEELWCLGDLVGSGPDAARVVAAVRAYCRVAIAGNHDYVATGAGSVRADAFGPPGSFARRSLEAAAEALAASGDLEWLRSRRPAARRHGVQCWHGSPRNPVHEYVGPSNAAACLDAQREDLGLVGHTHAPAAWQQTPAGARPTRIRPGDPLDLAGGKWLLNPGAVGAPIPPRAGCVRIATCRSSFRIPSVSYDNCRIRWWPRFAQPLKRRCTQICCCMWSTQAAPIGMHKSRL